VETERSSLRATSLSASFNGLGAWIVTGASRFSRLMKLAGELLLYGETTEEDRETPQGVQLRPEEKAPGPKPQGKSPARR